MKFMKKEDQCVDPLVLLSRGIKIPMAHSQAMDPDRVPNGGARERTQGAEEVDSPIRGTTICTYQYAKSSQGLNHQLR